MCWLCVLFHSSSNKLVIKEKAGGGLDVAPNGSSNAGPWVFAGEKTPEEVTLSPDVKPEQCKIPPAGEANEVEPDTKQGAPLRWVVKEEGNGSATVLSEKEWSLLPLRPSFSGQDGKKTENEKNLPDAQVGNAQHRNKENTEERKGASMREQAEKNTLCPSILSRLDEEKVQGCAQCEKTYCMNAHESQIMFTLEKLYQCLGCGKQFSSYGCVLSHKNQHKGEKPYQCWECGQSFWLKNELLSHQGTHLGENPYKCCECGKGFPGSTELIQHEIQHGRDKFYKCLECGKHFPSAGILDAHGKTHAEKQSGLDCGKSFHTSAPLISLQFAHMEEMLYTCMQCGAIFRGSRCFDIHQRVHIREKLYICVECGRCFDVRRSLTEHIRIHTGEKPYQCVECGRSFRVKKTLTVHRRTHMEEKPYKCLECGKSFTQKINLCNHQRIHTRKTTKTPEVWREFCLKDS
ncbi:zinc finger protein 660-like [Anolis sagrei]|uniref:zinc finger protein 660-like n=1 Tax=Anolis sagrei TaxID=38937 RepID=UPI00352140A3